MKKLFTIIGVVIIALFICGFLMSNGIGTQDQIEIGNNTFTLPSGYHEGNPNKMGDVNITDGTHSVFVSASNGDINKKIDGYVSYASKNNDSVALSNFSVNSTRVYKAINVNDTNFVRCWFEYNDTIYTVYTWAKNPDMDDIVSELIKSAGKST